MDSTYDPNVPDCTDEGFFCRLCLATMNSEQMWSSHIVGRRHIKNVKKYPNGLPKRFSDDEDSYDRSAKNDWYENDGENFNDYSYGNNYAPQSSIVRPSLVIDYGHNKKLEEILPLDREVPKEKVAPVAPVAPVATPPPKGFGNWEELLNHIKKSEERKSIFKSESANDDFFQKINQREIARDLALELSKTELFKGKDSSSDKASLKSEASKTEHFKGKDRDIDKGPLKSELSRTEHFKGRSRDIDKGSLKSEVSKRKAEDREEEKCHKRKPSTREDVIDLPHKSKEPPAKPKLKLKHIDPDNLTPDLLDDLLSSYMEAKANANTTPKETEKRPNLDDPLVIAEKIQSMPTKTFLKLTQTKLQNLDLKDSEELKMLLKIISDAQEIVAKKLPADSKLW